jgi:lipopolysaccharide export system protein LptC
MLKKLPTNVFSGILALTATVVFFFWLFARDEATNDLPTDAAAQPPEWYWETAEFWSFNTDGQLEQEVTASEAKYFKAEDIIYLRDPRITTHSGDQPPWYTRAERGEVREDNNIVELQEAVEIYQLDGTTRIHTEQLALIRNKSLAETPLKVIITGESSRTEAVGMRAWLEQEKVELLAKVKSIYEPK